ncbi:type II secretion system protein, partial [bacterium]|nr:type II secretion system protein [bacterium]
GQEGKRVETSLVKGRGTASAVEGFSSDKQSPLPFPPLTRGVKATAFTLAEVLITLGIIGIVAAMTLPALVTKYQQHVTVTRLKAFNSTMSQAFQRAKLDYGDFSNWDLYSSCIYGNCAHIDGSITLSSLKKYVLPYIKYTDVYPTSTYILVSLQNGSGFATYNSNDSMVYFFCVKFSDCKQNPSTYNSRSRFLFQFKPDKGFGPYDYGWKGTRDEFFKMNEGHHACNKNQGTGLCAKLIEYDGWIIKKDYPW